MQELEIKSQALKDEEGGTEATPQTSWGDDFFSFEREHNTDYGNEYNFKYSGTVKKWASSIEVFVTHEYYGELDNYVLQKFTQGDTTREYFTSPRFGTVMPGKNTYTFVVTRPAEGDIPETTREYVSVIDALWSDLIAMKEVGDKDLYSGVVKLNGKISREMIDYCTTGKDIFLCPPEEVIKTDMYYLHVHTVSDPRYWRFDDLESKEKLPLGCLDLDAITDANTVFAPSMVSYLRSQPSDFTTSLLLTKKTEREWENYGTCTVHELISRIDMVE